jgi:hypothetical protein
MAGGYSEQPDGGVHRERGAAVPMRQRLVRGHSRRVSGASHSLIDFIVISS